jgi:hypothetical protein
MIKVVKGERNATEMLVAFLRRLISTNVPGSHYRDNRGGAGLNSNSELIFQSHILRGDE